MATDGYYIENITDANCFIVNSGERYDVIVHANQNPKDYGILAQTLKDFGGSIFHNSINNHKAEAILHYDGFVQYYRNKPVRDTWYCIMNGIYVSM